MPDPSEVLMMEAARSSATLARFNPAALSNKLYDSHLVFFVHFQYSTADTFSLTYVLLKTGGD